MSIARLSSPSSAQATASTGQPEAARNLFGYGRASHVLEEARGLAIDALTAEEVRRGQHRLQAQALSRIRE